MELSLLLGLKFWKSPRRKLYAVRSSALKGKKRSKKRPSEFILSDSESEELTSKYPKPLIKIESSLEDMKEDVYCIESTEDVLKESADSVKVCLEDILQLSTMSAIPIVPTKDYVRHFPVQDLSLRSY